MRATERLTLCFLAAAMGLASCGPAVDDSGAAGGLGTDESANGDEPLSDDPFADAAGRYILGYFDDDAQEVLDAGLLVLDLDSSGAFYPRAQCGENVTRAVSWDIAGENTLRVIAEDSDGDLQSLRIPATECMEDRATVEFRSLGRLEAGIRRTAGCYVECSLQRCVEDPRVEACGRR